MAYDRLDEEDMPGYFLPEESQFRLAKLRDHVRFLVRLAQPRTPDEERAAEPKVRMGELAVCLELLADQVELVLDALSYPAQRTDTTHGARPAATVAMAPNVGSGAFRVTLAQLDRLTLLAETVSAHARVVAVGDATERAGQASPEVGDTLCDSANAMRALLLQIGASHCAHQRPTAYARSGRSMRWSGAHRPREAGGCIDRGMAGDEAGTRRQRGLASWCGAGPGMQRASVREQRE